MKTYIDKLTKEQKAHIPDFVKKWIDIGLRTGETDWDTFDKNMPICYEKAGLTYPKRVIRVTSPLVGALAGSIAEGIWKHRRRDGGAVDDVIRNALGNIVGGTIRDSVDKAAHNTIHISVGNAIHNSVGTAIHDSVGGTIRDSVDGAVGSVVRAAVDGGVDDFVGKAVRIAVDNAIYDNVRMAVDNAIYDAVYNVVGDAIHDSVDDTVNDFVDGAIHDAVDDVVGDAIHNVINITVHDAIGNAIGSAIDDVVRDIVDDAIHDNVGDVIHASVGSAISSAISSIEKKEGNTFSWHYWLGGQFWVGGWWLGSVTTVAFFMDVCKLELPEDIVERATAYRKVCESVSYIWPNRDFVMVCARPTKIEMDTQGRLHSMDDMAIKYPDGWGLYYIHGVKFDDAKLWKSITDGSISTVQVFAIANMEQRRVAYELMDKAKMLALDGLKILNKVADDGHGHPMRIVQFKIKGVDEPFRYLNCFCPSTGREYYLETQQKDCLTAKAESFGLPKDVEWEAEY